MQPLKKNKKMSITDSQQTWAIYFTYLYTFVWNCAFVRVWPKTHTHKKKEPMKKTYEPQRKKQKQKERKKESNEKKLKKEREVK